MQIKLSRVVLLSLLVAGIASAPVRVVAEDKKEAAQESHEAASAKEKHPPFRGKIAAVDKDAKTIKVGQRTFQITEETKLIKAGKPATFDDAVVGEEVGGQYKNADDGKLIVLSLRIGPKPDAEDGKSKKKE